jgi:hypothetical protein
MTLVNPTPSDAAKAKQIVSTTILADWAKRCGGPCVRDWNDSIGKVLNVSLPIPN